MIVNINPVKASIKGRTKETSKIPNKTYPKIEITPLNSFNGYEGLINFLEGFWPYCGVF